MAAPSYVFTIRHVAELLGQDEDVIEDIVLTSMGPEEGALSIIDGNPDIAVTAFTEDGIENLRQLLADRHNW